MAAFALGNLSLLLAIPVIGALILVLIPRQKSKTQFTCALFFTALTFLWSLNILHRFDGAQGEMQLVERAPWIRFYWIHYLVGTHRLRQVAHRLLLALTPIR